MCTEFSVNTGITKTVLRCDSIRAWVHTDCGRKYVNQGTVSTKTKPKEKKAVQSKSTRQGCWLYVNTSMTGIPLPQPYIALSLSPALSHGFTPIGAFCLPVGRCIISFIHNTGKTRVFAYTAKRVYKDRHRDQQNGILLLGWSLYTGSITWEVYPWGP